MADTVWENFGERLKRLREARGWSVYEASRVIGITPQGLYELERRATVDMTRATTLKLLADAYHVTVDYLFATTEECV